MSVALYVLVLECGVVMFVTVKQVGVALLGWRVIQVGNLMVGVKNLLLSLSLVVQSVYLLKFVVRLNVASNGC